MEIGLAVRLRKVEEEGCDAMSGNICTAEVGLGMKGATQVNATLTSLPLPPAYSIYTYDQHGGQDIICRLLLVSHCIS